MSLIPLKIHNEKVRKKVERNLRIERKRKKKAGKKSVWLMIFIEGLQLKKAWNLIRERQFLFH